MRLAPLATSLVLVARDNGGFSASDQGALVDSFTEHYLDAMAGYAGNSGETSRKFLASNTYGLLNNFLADTAADYIAQAKLFYRVVACGGNDALPPKASLRPLIHRSFPTWRSPCPRRCRRASRAWP